MCYFITNAQKEYCAQRSEIFMYLNVFIYLRKSQTHYQKFYNYFVDNESYNLHIAESQFMCIANLGKLAKRY